MKKIFALPLLILFSTNIFSLNIKVRIFAKEQINSVIITPATGLFQVSSDGMNRFAADWNVSIFFAAKGDSVEMKKGDTRIGIFQSVFLSEKTGDLVAGATFTVKLTDPARPSRVYTNGLRVTAAGGKLVLVNLVDIEMYTAGVVKAEVGISNPDEFNKVQSIIVRTYALNNLRRHEQEGYNLCDQVHCQVFYGKNTVKNLDLCTKLTEGLVLIDNEAKLVNTAFYSNCGGQTCNSEDAWTKPANCLKSVKDPYCTECPNATWEKKIPKDKWLSYFHDKLPCSDSDSTCIAQKLNFTQESRKKYLGSADCNMPLRNLREAFNLKSTFFSVSTDGDLVVLKGRGFGHGVGLCQEGAMQMAKTGTGYRKILEFYYSGSHLVDFNKVDFFKED